LEKSTDDCSYQIFDSFFIDGPDFFQSKEEIFVFFVSLLSCLKNIAVSKLLGLFANQSGTLDTRSIELSLKRRKSLPVRTLVPVLL
jgi:hypothetical protein